MKTILMKLTQAYDYQNFYNEANAVSLDFTGLEGTKCYCDDSAREVLKQAILSNPLEGLHFIDSGNFHYLSLLWLEEIKEDFSLVLFDHHPDNQPPSFGQILSCGGWVLEASENLPHLKHIYTYGVGDYMDPTSIPTDYPLYISIDKDVLSEEYAITDWDQGQMTLPEMLNILEEIYKDRRVIGVDICGDAGENPEDAAEINNQTNTILFDFFSLKF